MRTFVTLAVVSLLAATASAAPIGVTSHGDIDENGLAEAISSTDLIQGMIGTELAGDMGWHPANTNPADQLPAFTDGLGDVTGLTGLLNDNQPAISGRYVKYVEYNLGAVTDIGKVNVFTGNNGMDGRVFSTFVIEVGDGTTFSEVGYFESDPSGTINGGQWGSTLVSVTDPTDGIVGTGSHIRIKMWSADNTQGMKTDPYDGINPYTGVDDGFGPAGSSPLFREFDVFEVPEPASLALLALGGLFLRRRR